MAVTLRMRCPNCGKWNNIKTEKVGIELESQEPEVQGFIPTYLPLKTEACHECKQEIANQKEPIRIHPIDKKLLKNLKFPIR
jgi:hypothetical protein